MYLVDLFLHINIIVENSKQNQKLCTRSVTVQLLLMCVTPFERAGLCCGHCCWIYVWVLHKYFVMRDGGLSQCDIFNVQLFGALCQWNAAMQQNLSNQSPCKQCSFSSRFDLMTLLQVLRHHVMKCLCWFCCCCSHVATWKIAQSWLGEILYVQPFSCVYKITDMQHPLPWRP